MPARSAQSATSSSSHTTWTGSGAAAATTRSAIAPGQLGPLGRTEDAGQPALGGAEALDRHQDSGAHAGECTGEEREATGLDP